VDIDGHIGEPSQATDHISGSLGSRTLRTIKTQRQTNDDAFNLFFDGDRCDLTERLVKRPPTLNDGER
jgi:hypothetical protein